MRTIAFAPPFPIDLASWITAFRHRVTNERGHPASPEQLGRQIGVSGATIRRWESGRLRPSPEDAAALAIGCRLTPLHVTFLNRALNRRGPTPVPDIETFRRKATLSLSVDFPVYIMDSLMFIRGWNSYLPCFLEDGRQVVSGEQHIIEFMIEAGDRWGTQPSTRERVRQTVIELWMLTADACGTPEYQALLAHLSKHKVFEEEWSRLAFMEEQECIQIGLPRTTWREDIGSCLICPFTAVLPPVYYLRQFIPLDEVGRRKLDAIRKEGPPIISFDSRYHWAQTAGNEPYFRVS